MSIHCDTSIYHDIRYIDTTSMYINTVSPPNVSRYGDISIYCCISSMYTCVCILSRAEMNIKFSVE